MKRISIIIIYLCLVFSSLACARMKEEITVQPANTAMLEGKIINLEKDFSLVDKSFERIINNQKDIFSTMIYFLIGITTILLSVNWFNNRYFIRDTTNKAREELRREFAVKINEINLKIKESNEAKIKIIEEKHELKFKKLEGWNYNAIGRIYEIAKSNYSSAVWFARGLECFIEGQSSDEAWIKLQIVNVSQNLKLTASITDPDDIVEIQKIINKIPEEKYKEEKADLQGIFSEKIKSKDTEEGSK